MYCEWKLHGVYSQSANPDHTAGGMVKRRPLRLCDNIGGGNMEDDGERGVVVGEKCYFYSLLLSCFSLISDLQSILRILRLSCMCV